MCGEILKISSLSEKFRDPIDKCDKRKYHNGFANFPSGTCRDTCLLLEKYLRENGVNNIYLVSGGFETSTHSWLEINSVAVDITADQFPGHKKVIVSINYPWHKEIFISKQIAPQLESYNRSEIIELWELYNNILENILQL